MFLDELQNFYLTAESDSLAKASEQLSIDRSALSKHISRIERALGVRLFHRRPKGMTLTNSGRSFQALCKAFLDGCSTLALANPGDVLEGKAITVGLPSCRDVGEILGYIGDYAREHTDVSIMFRQQNAMELAEALRGDKINFAIISSVDVPERMIQSFECVVLNKCSLKIQVALTHPLADRDSVDFMEVKDENFIIPDGFGTGRSRRLNRLCSQYGVGTRPKLKFAVSDAGLISTMVRAGIGIAITAVQEGETPPEGTKFLDIHYPNYSYPPQEKLLLLWRMEAYRNMPHVREFAKYIVKRLLELPSPP